MHAPKAKAKANVNVKSAQRHSPTANSPYRARSVYLKQTPVQSESERLRLERSRESMLNFGCLSYDSLIAYCKAFGLHRIEYDNHYERAQSTPSERGGDVDVDVAVEEAQRARKRRRLETESETETEHHYLECDLLDAHYERRRRRRIPRTFAAETRATKSELVEVVKTHFLATPLMADMTEMEVIGDFLRFIQRRRNELKKQFVPDDEEE